TSTYPRGVAVPPICVWSTPPLSPPTSEESIDQVVLDDDDVHALQPETLTTPAVNATIGWACERVGCGGAGWSRSGEMCVQVGCDGVFGTVECGGVCLKEGQMCTKAVEALADVQAAMNSTDVAVQAVAGYPACPVLRDVVVTAYAVYNASSTA
ncbi:hypothetical protein HK101_006410, partial [Irineochytrium annulatum]